MQTVQSEVVLKAQKGDMEAFETIYKITSDFVYNVVYRVLNNKEDAADVTQEVFMNIYRKINNFRFESSFTTWVYRIAVNMSLTYLKRISNVKDRPALDDINLDNYLSAENVLGTVYMEDDKNMIEKLLGHLNPDQRACITLRCMEGLSYGQIAQTLRINVNTVRTRLKRAREKLLSIKQEGNL